MSTAPASGAYPGNPSLPREVRDKILSTFRHTLNLFREGKMDDCVIGCDFILKMDPRFTPARQLMEKAKNSASAVDVAQLESLVADTPTRQERVASVETDRLLVRAVESYNARDFTASIAAAEQVLKVLPGNRDAARILEKARQRQAAQPQFEAARQRGIAALDARHPAEARSALEKMRALDAEHPAVALLERRLAAAAPAAAEIGESTNPGISPPPSSYEAPPSGGGLEDLSLDSLSLDESLQSGAAVPPPADMGEPVTGPLSLGESRSSGAGSALDTAAPPNLWSEEPQAPQEIDDLTLDVGPSPGFSPTSPPQAAPEPPSQEQEIQSLLSRGDEAAGMGNRQQAIEIWSRIFLIDINNSEAVGRIEKARQEMAEGNRRVAEGLKRGRENFEGGDFAGAREVFLQVLAIDETDQTARSYMDRIEQELARPSSGLDLSKKAPQGDILAEEMEQAAKPEVSEPAEAMAPPEKAPSLLRPRRGFDKRFVAALAGALLLVVAVGAYFLLRPSHGGKSAGAAAEGGPSLEHATMLFREGKLAETVAELRQIPAGHPDYARAQKLLASLTRRGEAAAPPGAPETDAAEKPAPASGPPPEASRLRAEAEKALAEKRYIDALKDFNLAAPSFQGDPTFAQSMGAALEKVNELTPAVKLYNDGEYDTAVPILWRLFQTDRTNHDARSYLLRCYYNQGIAQLQNGLYPKAAESFKEVLAIDPGDADAIRHKRFAERYLKGDLDLMGRIYVRHIQQRP
ncbi:MAG TPA: hypothetical protein VGL03_02370 [Thermoanaerobaculia bacterium]